MARKRKNLEEVTIVKGSHLTVYTYSDGRTELEWDHDALLRDVTEAILSVEEKTSKSVKPKRSRKGE